MRLNCKRCNRTILIVDAMFGMVLCHKCAKKLK